MYCRSCYHDHGYYPMDSSWHWGGGWDAHHHWQHNQNPHYGHMRLADYGRRPFVVNIDQATKQNNTFRTAIWTGKYFQVTLMSINVGDDIGLEIHPNTDQFIRLEQGQGIVQMGDRKDRLDFQARVHADDAIMIPAGKWHNVINTGRTPMKVYVIYAPPEHPFGTVHETKAAAMAAEQHHS